MTSEISTSADNEWIFCASTAYSFRAGLNSFAAASGNIARNSRSTLVASAKYFRRVSSFTRIASTASSDHFLRGVLFFGVYKLAHLLRTRLAPSGTEIQDDDLLPRYIESFTALPPVSFREIVGAAACPVAVTLHSKTSGMRSNRP